MLGVKSAKVKRISAIGDIRDGAEKVASREGQNTTTAVLMEIFFVRRFEVSWFPSRSLENPFPSLYLNRTDRKRGTKAKDNNDKCRLFNQRKSARVTVVIIN